MRQHDPVDDDLESVRMTLAPGTRWAILLTLPLVGLALYYAFTPWMLPSQNGYIDCGTAFNQPTVEFNQNVCNGVGAVNRVRVLALLGTALAVLVGAFALFGLTPAGRAPRGVERGGPQVRRDRDLDDRAEGRVLVDDRFDDDLDETGAESGSHSWIESGPEARARSHRRLPWRREEDIDLSVDADADDDLDDPADGRRGRRSAGGAETDRRRVDDDWTV